MRRLWLEATIMGVSIAVAVLLLKRMEEAFSQPVVLLSAGVAIVGLFLLQFWLSRRKE
ncbi:MAG: hypothetical protein MUD01_04335 [Chloroflexaceae bacterium]|nr:hypothetical protein [Chloroflexaceae bacterium]